MKQYSLKAKCHRLGYLFLLILLTMVLTGISFSGTAKVDDTRSTHIFFHTGSPLLLDGDRVLSLDTENPDVAATVINGRTLIPLRAFAEHFGSKVSYDAVSRIAIIENSGSRYLFPIGKQSYITETGSARKEIAMDTGSLILNDRTMVPLRVLCEDVFHQKVSYYDRVIAVGDTEIDLATQGELFRAVQNKIGVALKARNLNEVKAALSGQNIYRYGKDAIMTGEMSPALSQEQKSAEGAADFDSGNAGNFSSTNTQVEGIDEADLVKTDGDNIYIVAQSAIRIISADRGKLNEITLLRIDEKKNVREIFLDGDRLVVIGTRNEYDAIYPVNEGMDEKMIMPRYIPMKTFTFVDVYNIINPKNPGIIKSHEIEGSYQTSRKNGNIVYLVSNTFLYGDIYLPTVKDTATGSIAKACALDDVMIFPRYPAQGFVVVSAIDIRTDEKAEIEAIAASGTVTYMNDHALYIAASNFNGKTSITKFSINGLNIGYAGSGEVPGYLINQFAMDEYEDHLRVAVTVWGEDNSLYVLDHSMNISGSVTGLAKGETIYSVRFLGDKGYIVTFRTIDPLFIFDLSDPGHPRVTGELKIPGFSNYLHPVDENHLLGIGMDVKEIYQKDKYGKEVVIGTQQGGIKISLFDVSDMGKPIEISQYILGDAGSYSEALNNHKAIMFDKRNNQFGFDASVTSDSVSYKFDQGAVLISYANNRITVKNFLISKQSENYGSDVPNARRILYIGDELYYVQGSKIISYDYDTFHEIDSLTLY